MMIRRTRMRLEVVVRTRGEIILIVSMSRIIQIKEEEEEGKDLEEEVFVENVFIVKRKGIDYLNVPNSKEGQIGEPKARLELCMLMKMLNPYIMKILKEEKSQLK